VSGTINNGDVAGCAPQHTPGVLQIHGTSDFIVSYNGSIFSGLGVQAVLDLWTGNLDCATPAVITPINSTVEQQVYSPCNGGAIVVHDKITGGGHTWPTGATFSATNVIWDFFQQFTCGEISTTVSEPATTALAAWPVPADGEVVVEGLTGPTPYVLVDGMGRTVRTGRADGPRTIIALDGFATGTYLIRLLDGTGCSVRVVKQ